jgi:hypothetical protein
MFQRHLGRSYREVEWELSWYIATALSSYSEAPAMLPTMPKVSLAPAKPSEIARVLGEWERVEAEVLAAKLPEVAQNYRKQATEKLQRAYERGVRHPQLLATLGLLMLESGNDAGARKYLEEATAANAAGPRPYLELAHLLWRDAPAQDRVELTQPAWEKITDLLLHAEDQGPPARITYAMLAELKSVAPTRREPYAAALRRGTIYFPRDAALLQSINEALNEGLKN